jgi:CRP-like cAMP-binding protein
MLDASTLSQLHRAHAEMLTRERTRQIGAAPMFAGASQENQALLAATARLVHVGDGEVVIAEGDQTTSAYLVWSGSANVVNDAGDVLAVFRAGELFGEAAAAADTPTYRFERTATVRAAGPVELYQIPADSLKRLIEAEPVVRDRIRGLIRERIGLDQMREHVKSV